MKPIKLEMNYFGPFENETIDFESINNQMFLISGKTGSGKTMIFDAITYALYGTLSTSDRMEGSVRSQFAAESNISSVKLLFEIKGRKYTVERTLSYQKEGRKTPVPPKAVLFDGDGEVLEGSINGVKQRVYDIIKLNADQFRQILLLPQGEFKRLLISTSESKQEILRTLFRTERFVHFEYRLNDLKKEKLKDTELVETKVEELFNTLGGTAHPEVEPLINAEFPTFNKRIETIHRLQEILNSHKDKLSTQIDGLRKDSQNLNDLLQKKERHNQQVEKLNESKAKYAEHRKQKQGIEKIEADIKQYKEVKSIEYELRAEAKAVEQSVSLKENLKKLEQGYEEVESACKSLREALDGLSDYDEAYRKNVRWLNATERFVDDERYVDLPGNLKNCGTEKESLDDLITELTEASEQTAEENVETIWSREHSDALKQKKYTREAAVDKIKEAIKNEEKNIEYDKEKAELQNEMKKIERGLQNIEDAAAKMREAVSRKHASEDRAHIEHLVEHLTVGGACPVCRQRVDVLPDQHEYLSEAEEARFKHFEEEKQELNLKAANNEKRIGIIDGILESLDRHDLGALKNELEAAETGLNAVLDDIESDRRAFDKKQAIEKRSKQLENDLNKRRIELKDINNIISQLKSQQDDFEKSTGFIQYDDFRESYKKRYEEVTAHEASVREKEKQKQQSDERRSRLEENIKHSRDQLEKIEIQIMELSPVIDGFIQRRGAADRQALVAIIKNPDIEKHEQAVKSYYTEEEVLSSRIKDLEMILESGEIIELDEEREKLKNIDAEKDHLTDERARLEAQIQHNNGIDKKIRDLSDKYEKELVEINALVELVDAVSGRNEQKVSLERFVLTYYLDRILQIANIRLLEMTNHRYELRRSTSRSNRKTGLDIEVFDFYNNQSRHISSLSGGESFQASLTLALALNEALQQESGGITLDTMLIDEGFGTLDPETLDTAISTLIELQTGGKMVGIISHVEELKDRMDHILEVRAVNERSTTRFK